MKGTETSYEAKLDDLLCEEIDSAKQREESAFDAQVAPFGKSLVLFGSGNMGRRVLARLRQDGVEPLAFVDNDHSIWGSTIDGLAVLAPAEAARRYGNSATFVVTIYNIAHSFLETRRQLLELGCARVVSVVPLRWKYHETFLPLYRDDLPHKVLLHKEMIREAFSLWSDDASRREFLAQVKWRLHGSFDELGPPSEEDQYFPRDLLQLTPDTYFVDIGAYDGDTIRQFLAHSRRAFRQIVALEPDPLNFQKLEAYVETMPPDLRYRIDIRALAVGSVTGRVRFDAGHLVSSAMSMSGPVEVDCTRIDDLLADGKPTYIKMDIEGAESDALTGASRTIATHSPLLAVCVYHRQDDLWRIPLQIHKMSDRYRFILRPYEFECWETVCYAVPD